MNSKQKKLLGNMWDHDIKLASEVPAKGTNKSVFIEDIFSSLTYCCAVCLFSTSASCDLSSGRISAWAVVGPRRSLLWFHIFFFHQESTNSLSPLLTLRSKLSSRLLIFCTINHFDKLDSRAEQYDTTVSGRTWTWLLVMKLFYLL